MLNIIVGENASGKTAALNEVLEQYSLRDVATNIADTSAYDVDVVDEKIDKINIKMPFDIERQGTTIRLSAFDPDDDFDYDRCKEMYAIFDALCSNKKYLVWDEPELGLPNGYRGWLFEAISMVTNSFEEVWITTHFEGADLMHDAKFYVVDKNKQLKEISGDDASELLSKI